MCRALLYLGQPVLLDNLLFLPDSALVRQSYMPKMLHMLNLAGFGMRAWDPATPDPERPFSYYSQSLPVFDRNLKGLAEKIRADCVLAHVRGVAYSTRVEISLQNVHPFHFAGVPLVLAHNGDLARFAEMKPHLHRHVDPEFAAQVHGTTDSEWVYALLVSQLLLGHESFLHRKIAHDAPVAHHHHALRVAGHVVLMRHHQDRDALVVQPLENPEDLDARARVEIARRLVGEQEHGIID